MADSPARNDQLLAEFAEYLQKYGRKKATIDSYTSDTHGFMDYVTACYGSAAAFEPKAEQLDWRHIGAEHLLNYQKHLIEDEQAMANSVRRKVLAIRQFFRFLAGAELLPDSPVEAVPVPKRDDGLPEQLHYRAIDKLVSLNPLADNNKKAGAEAENEPENEPKNEPRGETLGTLGSLKGWRDQAILTLIALEGVKSTELINLIWSHHRDNPANPGAYLHIGGQRKRTLKLAPATRTLLSRYRQSYFAEAGLAALPAAEQKVLVSFKGPGGGLISPAMTRHGLKFLLYELGGSHGIDGLNAEMLRHYCIRHHLEQGMAPEELMDKLGLKRLGVISRHMRQLERDGIREGRP